MTQSTFNQVLTADTRESNMQSIFNFGGGAVLVAFLVALLDTCLTFIPSAITPDPGKGTAVDWFTFLQRNWFLGVRGLGLFNVIGSVLLVLVFVVLYAAISQGANDRQSNKVHAALAVILLGIGTTIYIANNPALPMLQLSSHYTSAATEAERSLLAGSGQALLVRGEDFTPGAFPGFVLNEVANLLMVLVMLRSGLFSKLTVWSGILGFSCLLIFTIWSTFVPVFYAAAMMVAMVGGLLSMIWYILVARRFFQLGRSIS